MDNKTSQEIKNENDKDVKDNYNFKVFVEMDEETNLHELRRTLFLTEANIKNNKHLITKILDPSNKHVYGLETLETLYELQTLICELYSDRIHQADLLIDIKQSESILNN